MIQMDVTDDASVARGVDSIMKGAGRLDVVLNNAGIGIAGPVEDATLDQVKRQFDTNFFGVVRMCQAVLPVMREQGAGHIINISSLAGRVGLPYQAFYSASKYAVEGLTESLRYEVRHFGIKVVLIEPGDTQTEFTDNRVKLLRTEAYAQYCNNALRVYESDERHGSLPGKVGPLVERIIRDPNPRLRYTFGSAFQTFSTALKSFVPHRLFEWAFAQIYTC
jgi:NAD(P)-dependent dehydrogenase (short-subunit alcohol dehydrogenase family)